MSHKQLISNLSLLIQAFEQNWGTSLVLAIFALAGLGVIAFGIVLVRHLILSWRTRISQNALTQAKAKADEYLQSEMERLQTIQLRAQTAVDEKQEAVQAALHSVWGATIDLYFAICGTSSEFYQGLSEILQLLGLPALELKVKESYRPFVVELLALAKALFKLSSMVDAARVELSEVEFFGDWVRELEAHWKKFVSDEDWDNHSIEMRLTILQECHAHLGQAYSHMTPAYRSFLGTLHVLEALVEDRAVPAKALWPYIDSLDSQLWHIRRALPKEAAMKAARADETAKKIAEAAEAADKAAEAARLAADAADAYDAYDAAEQAEVAMEAAEQAATAIISLSTTF